MAARVLVVGAGGLGSPALLYLAAAGVGTLGIVDDDAVALSNLQRQVIHDTAAVGTPKVASAAHALGRLNPHVAVETHALRLDAAARGRARAALRPRARRQRQLRHPLPRQRRLRRRGQAAGLGGDEPVGGAARGVPPGGRRPLLPMPVPRAARPGAGPELRRRRHHRRAAGRHGLDDGARGDQADRPRRHPARRRAADLRRAPRRDPPPARRTPRRTARSAVEPAPPEGWRRRIGRPQASASAAKPAISFGQPPRSISACFAASAP